MSVCPSHPPPAPPSSLPAPPARSMAILGLQFECRFVLLFRFIEAARDAQKLRVLSRRSAEWSVGGCQQGGTVGTPSRRY